MLMTAPYRFPEELPAWQFPYNFLRATDPHCGGVKDLRDDVALRTFTNDAGLKNFLFAYTTDSDEKSLSSPAVEGQVRLSPRRWVGVSAPAVDLTREKRIRVS